MKNIRKIDDLRSYVEIKHLAEFILTRTTIEHAKAYIALSISFQQFKMINLITVYVMPMLCYFLMMAQCFCCQIEKLMEF